MQAGRDAGMTTVLVNWGYIAADDAVDTWPADYRVDQPADILNLV